MKRLPILMFLCMAVGVSELTIVDQCRASSDKQIFRETFDTAVFRNGQIFRSPSSGIRVRRGALGIDYFSSQDSPANGIECVLPAMADGYEEREISLRFLGGGTEMSNSLFVAYSVGPGQGLCLPPLPSGGTQHERSGYIIRLIRHGDGTNEVKFYRDDTGWTKVLHNDWTLPSNPITTLRSIVIKQSKTGHHAITIAFDTGASFTRTYSYTDSVHPPNQGNRGIQVLMKGHAGVSTNLNIVTDTWIVVDRMSSTFSHAGEQGGQDALSRGGDRHGPFRIANAAIEFQKARKAYDDRHYDVARDTCFRLLRENTADDDILELLGLAESAMENYSEAHGYFLRSLEIRENKYGEFHPKIAVGLTHLAELYHMKDLAESERLYRQALSVLDTGHGYTVYGSIAALNGLARIYEHRMQYDSAEIKYREALAVQAKFPDGGQTLAEGYMRLAGIYERRRKLSEAEKYYERSLALAETSMGGDHPTVAAILHHLEAIYEAQSTYSKLEPTYRRLIGLTEKTMGPDHPDVARRVQNLAVIFQNQQRYTEAELMYKRALAITEKAKGSDNPDVATILYNLGVLKQLQGSTDDAASYYERALTIRERAFGKDDARLANILNNLADLYHTSGNNAAAEKIYIRLQTIKEKSLGKNHNIVADGLNNLGAFYFRQGRYADAESQFRRALAIKEKNLGSNHPEVAVILDNLAIVCKRLNRQLEASLYSDRAARIRRR